VISFHDEWINGKGDEIKRGGEGTTTRPASIVIFGDLFHSANLD
jgi:hypothetical protein